jgi:hypothetical protein
MADSGIVNREAAELKSLAIWETKQQNLTDKLRRTNNKEVVILDDYDGESHKHGVGV